MLVVHTHITSTYMIYNIYIITIVYIHTAYIALRNWDHIQESRSFTL
jgi:hypothetical protein